VVQPTTYGEEQRNPIAFQYGKFMLAMVESMRYVTFRDGKLKKHYQRRSVV
jgi:hypothetical protein